MRSILLALAAGQQRSGGPCEVSRALRSSHRRPPGPAAPLGPAAPPRAGRPAKGLRRPAKAGRPALRPPATARIRRSLALRAVLKPLPRYLADAPAFVFRRDLPGLVKVGRRQQAVGEQEIGEITRVTPF